MLYNTAVGADRFCISAVDPVGHSDTDFARCIDERLRVPRLAASVTVGKVSSRARGALRETLRVSRDLA